MSDEWTASTIEEVISALWFLVGLLAWQAGVPHWLCWLVFAHAAFGGVFSFYMAFTQARERFKQKREEAKENE